jgi:hypothetical protein
VALNFIANESLRDGFSSLIEVLLDDLPDY